MQEQNTVELDLEQMGVAQWLVGGASFLELNGVS